MSNHREPRDMRSEGIHFKNKYKFMTLKITLMPQVIEASVGSNVNKKNLHYNTHSSYVLMSHLQAQYFQEPGIFYFCLLY